MNTKNNQSYYKFAIFAYISPLALQIAFFVYQIKNKIYSIWNIIATAMLVGIFANIIRMMINDKKKVDKPKDPNEITGGSTVDYSKPQKQSKKSIAIKTIISIVLLGLSILFFNIFNTKSRGLETVNSTVVSQWGETTVTTEETDEGITQTEEDYIEVVVKYEYNGEQKSAKITGKTTDKIYVDELKIFVNEKGDFVSDYGRILVWKLEAIIFLITAILLLLFTFLSLGIEFIAGLIFTSAGSALFFLIGCPFIENILFNDITCFVAMFANVGIYMLLFGFINLIFSKRKDLNQETNLSPVQTYPTEQSQQEQIAPIKPIEITCKSCGSKLSPNDKFCQYCGTKKD